MVYNGKIHQMREKLEIIISDLLSVQHVIIIPFLKNTNGGLKTFSHENWYIYFYFYFKATFQNMNSYLLFFTNSLRKWSSELLDDIRTTSIKIQYEQVPFDHPLFVLYSSGTTGKPKCMIHSVGVRTL